jgi:hypothetical protein
MVKDVSRFTFAPPALRPGMNIYGIVKEKDHSGAGISSSSVNGNEPGTPVLGSWL